jgi:alpha-glucosidase
MNGFIETIGKVKLTDITANEIGMKGVNLQVKVQLWKENCFRVQVFEPGLQIQNPYAVVAQPEQVAQTTTQHTKGIKTKTSEASLIIDFEPFSISFLNQHGVLLAHDKSMAVVKQGQRLIAHHELQKDDAFYGLGEKTGPLNRRGRAYTNWNTDYFAYGVEADPLYASIPFYLGKTKAGWYGLFLDCPGKSQFNFGASNHRFSTFSTEGGGLDYYVMTGENPAAILQTYTWLTGRMPLPPKWSLGLQQCRYSYYPEHELHSLADNYRNRGISADVLYLDIHYMEAYKVFTWHKERFPDPKAMHMRLAEKGFKTVAIIDPGVKTEPGYPVYESGKASDVFLSYPDGHDFQAQVWPGWCHFPDFTEENARKWWTEQVKQFMDSGLSGCWNDMNEPATWGQSLPDSVLFGMEGHKLPHPLARNVYGMQMARATHEGMKSHAPNERVFVLTRAAFSGIQRYAALWTGDNVASDEHMMAGIRLCLSLGLSGVPFTGMDVGGFVGESSPALFARWISIASFMPLFRIHSMIDSKESDPWSYGEKTEAICKNYINLRYRLLPTLVASFAHSAETGLPINEAMIIRHPNLEVPDAYAQQFYLGNLLVCPTESQKEATKVWLPDTPHYHLFTGKKYAFGEHWVHSPVDTLPVFVAEGSVLLMQSLVPHTDAPHNGILEIHLFAGNLAGKATWYEDDGLTESYANGGFYSREIFFTGTQVTIAANAGKSSSSFTKIKLVLHGWEGKLANFWKKETYQFLDELPDFDPFSNEHKNYAIPVYTTMLPISESQMEISLMVSSR